MKTLRPRRHEDAKGWAEEIECNANGGCGALLLVEENDIFQTRWRHFDDSGRSVFFICPECGCQSEINNPPSGFAIPDKEQWLAQKQD